MEPERPESMKRLQSQLDDLLCENARLKQDLDVYETANSMLALEVTTIREELRDKNSRLNNATEAMTVIRDTDVDIAESQMSQANLNCSIADMEYEAERKRRVLVTKYLALWSIGSVAATAVGVVFDPWFYAMTAVCLIGVILFMSIRMSKAMDLMDLRKKQLIAYQEFETATRKLSNVQHRIAQEDTATRRNP